jgi:Ca2+-binding EF-hand superfamily protein
MDRANSRRCGARGTALWLASASAVLILTACASDDHPRRREGFRGDEFGGGPRPSLFVSPAGEPFRAPPGAPYPIGAWFTQADKNHDGKLTREEFVADAARFFAVLDTNRDGVVDGLELKTYETEIVPEITEERGGAPPGGGQTQGFGSGGGGGGSQGGGGGGRRRRGGGGGGGGGAQGQGGGAGPGQSMPQATGAGPYGLLGEREPVASADFDLNSRITLANFRKKAEQRFTTLDADGNGYLVLAELPKTLAQRQAEGRKARQADKPPS